MKKKPQEHKQSWNWEKTAKRHEASQHIHYLHSTVRVATGDVWYPNPFEALQ